MSRSDPPHVLVVTGHYDLSDQVDEREFQIECPGVTDCCRLWVPCDCPESADPDRLWDDNVAHDVVHQSIDNEWWGVATDRCLYVDPDTADPLPDVASALRAPGGHEWGLDAGRYPVQPTWLGEGEFALDLVPAGDIMLPPAAVAAAADNETVTVTGQVTDLVGNETKQGSPWGSGILACADGQVRLEIWPATYAQYGHLLGSGVTVAVTGRIDRRDGLVLNAREVVVT